VTAVAAAQRASVVETARYFVLVASVIANLQVNVSNWEGWNRQEPPTAKDEWTAAILNAT
jgi:hypothetical protein